MARHTWRALALLVSMAGAAGAQEAPTALVVRFADGERTKLDLVGEGGLGGVLGTASVKRDKGRAEVRLEMPPLPHPQLRSPLFTTYVAWAIGPEGQAERLAEIVHGREVDVKATASLPTFALIVTAEPHGLVSRPSAALVARATPASGARALGGPVDVVVDRTWMEMSVKDIGPGPDEKTPLLVQGARRAVQIARFEGAGAEDLHEAEVKLEVLEHLWPERRKDSGSWESLTRDVMRLAEHARGTAAERRLAEARLAEQRAAARRVADAQAAAQSALTEAERARQQAEEERDAAQEALETARRERAQAEAARLEVERARQQEEAARSEADRARAEEAAARDAAARERADREALQAQLERSLAAVLETRREARGLIVNLSDVLFDTAKSTLTAGAREKLSRVAGILVAYPGDYRIEIEGHTDSVGSEAYNLRLSESRAASVQTYLLGTGIPAARITATRGLGESRPVADNINAAGRQRNRRVELVIDDRPR